MTEPTFRRFKAIGASGRNRLEDSPTGNFMLVADHQALMDEQKKLVGKATHSANLAKNAMDEMQEQHELTQTSLQATINEMQERLDGRHSPDDYAAFRLKVCIGLYPTRALAEAAVALNAYRTNTNPMLYQVQPRWK